MSSTSAGGEGTKATPGPRCPRQQRPMPSTFARSPPGCPGPGHLPRPRLQCRPLHVSSGLLLLLLLLLRELLWARAGAPGAWLRGVGPLTALVGLEAAGATILQGLALPLAVQRGPLTSLASGCVDSGTPASSPDRACFPARTASLGAPCGLCPTPPPRNQCSQFPQHPCCVTLSIQPIILGSLLSIRHTWSCLPLFLVEKSRRTSTETIVGFSFLVKKKNATDIICSGLALATQR